MYEDLEHTEVVPRPFYTVTHLIKSSSFYVLSLLLLLLLLKKNGVVINTVCHSLLHFCVNSYLVTMISIKKYKKCCIGKFK